MPTVTADDIRKAVRDLNLDGKPIELHVSLGSYRDLEGGADALIDALLAEDCTIVIPTFSWAYAVAPPEDGGPERNGLDENGDYPRPNSIDEIYTPESNELDEDEMGTVAAHVLARPERVRGNHPLSSFTGLGPQAEEIISTQTPTKVWAPLRKAARLKGSVVLMGVYLDVMSLLHAAEEDAGRRMFRRWAKGPDGEVIEVAVGGCSKGFEKLGSIVSVLQKRKYLNTCLWRVYGAWETLDLASDVIASQPTLTFCGDRSCARCRDMMPGGPPDPNDDRPPVINRTYY